MKIIRSTAQDIDLIFEFYDAAVELQKKVYNKHWLGFEREMVEREIAEGRQWKVVEDDMQVACIFAVAFNDRNIWKERDQSDAIYLHRIVTHPARHGRGYVRHIVDWAKEYARSISRTYVRLDTWGDNQKLIEYYQQCGFTFLGIIVPDITGLPSHYKGITLSLFELKSW